MSFQLQKATRTGIKPLIGIYGESGTGKTFSALLLARGFVGPTGRIGMCDTEAGRGSLYADVIPGGYEVFQLNEPFTPVRAVEAITALEQSGVDIAILDSTSHFWEGIGGVLDMAGDIEEKTGKAGLHCWKAPKMAHNLMMRKLLQSRLPIIVCLRAKYKSRQVKNEHGKTQIIKDDYTSPIQSEDFLFELMVHGETLPDHSFHVTKISHPALRNCFPEKKPITVEHGALLATWCAAGAVPSSAAPAVPLRPQSPAPAAAPSKVKLSDAEKVQKWKARCIQAAAGDERYAIEMAVDAGILLPNEKLDDWPVDKLPKTKEQVDFILSAISDKAGIPKNPEEIVP